MKKAIFSLATVLACLQVQAQTIVKLTFDDFADGTYTSGTAYVPGGSEIVDTASFGLGTASFEFVDSGAPDDANEVAADGAAIGAVPGGITGVRQGGKALLLNGNRCDEGVRMFVGDALTSTSFTMEAIWYSSDVSAPNSNGGFQTVIGDNWPQLDLFGTDPRRSQFILGTQGANRFNYSGDQGSYAFQANDANENNEWTHDALVFEYNDANPAASKVRGYRNGGLVGEVTYNAAIGEDVGLFGVTTASLGLHTLTIGMSNSFEYRINDHRRGVNGAIDAIAVTSGTLTPAQFVLPFDKTGPVALNGSFELNANPNAVGYSSDIPNWTTVGSGSGVNQKGPFFFDNGVAPDGTWVGFIQNQTNKITQLISGFDSTKHYRLRMHVNRREGTGATAIKATLGSTVLIPSTNVNAVGGNNAFTLLSTHFNPPGDGAFLLTLENSGPAGDQSVLFDNILFDEFYSDADDWSLYQ